MRIQRALWLLLFTLYSLIYAAFAFHNDTLYTKDFVFSTGWYANGTACGGANVLRTDTIGSYFTVDFTGIAVSLGVTNARDRGLISVTINGTDYGKAATWLETDDPATWGCVDVAQITGLPLGAHQFKATLSEAHYGSVLEVLRLMYTAPDPSDIPSPPPVPSASSSSLSASLVASTSSQSSSSSPRAQQTTSRSSTSLSSARPSITRDPTPSMSTLSATLPTGPLKTAEVTPDDSRIQYLPPEAWQVREETLCDGRRINTRTTSQPSAKLVFSFKGSSISLRGLDRSTAACRVSLDGGREQELKPPTPPGSTCPSFDEQYHWYLDDSDHLITVSVPGGSDALSARATEEFVFAGFQYAGVDALGTAPPPSSSSPNFAAIGGGVGGALAGILLVCLAIFGYRRWKVWRARRHLAPSTIYMESKSRFPPIPRRASPTWTDEESVKASTPDSTAYENLIAGPPSARSPSFRWRTKTLSSLSAWRTGRGFPRPSVSSPSSATHIPDPIPNSIY